MIPRQARRADPRNSGSEGDGNGGDVGDVRGLSIMGVTMLAILLLSFAFAVLSALVRLISRLLLLLVTLLLVGEVRVTALPLDHREVVGVLLIVTALAMGGFTFVLCKDGFTHFGEGKCRLLWFQWTVAQSELRSGDSESLRYFQL
jgi:hypothetical protein